MRLGIISVLTVLIFFPATAHAATFTDSSYIQSQISNLSPSVASILKPGFTAIDGWRLSGVTYLETSSAAKEAEIEALTEKRAELLKDGSDEAKKESRNLGIKQMIQTSLIYLYAAFTLALSKAIIFYPVSLFLFFLLLWKIVRRFTRRRYD